MCIAGCWFATKLSRGTRSGLCRDTSMAGELTPRGEMHIVSLRSFETVLDPLTVPTLDSPVLPVLGGLADAMPSKLSSSLDRFPRFRPLWWLTGTSSGKRQNFCAP